MKTQPTAVIGGIQRRVTWEGEGAPPEGWSAEPRPQVGNGRPAQQELRPPRRRRAAPGLLAVLLAAGLAGCGFEDGGGDFQEYGQLEGQAADAAPDAPPGAAPCGSARPQEAPYESPASLPLAFFEPPVEAPVPEYFTDVAAAPGPADDVLAVAEAPVPGALPGSRAALIADAAATAAAGPREVEVLVKEQTFRVEGPEEAIRVSYDDIDLLKVLNMEPVTADAPRLMPEWLKQLDGRRIRIRGFMYPAFKETGLRAFVLARDNEICCFGRWPKIYDVFRVQLRDGQTTSYIQNRPFDVVGVFHIEPVVEKGQLFELYRIDDASVINK